MAGTKTKERQLASETKSPKKNRPVSYPFIFVEKRHNLKTPRRKISIKNKNRNERDRKHHKQIREKSHTEN